MSLPATVTLIPVHGQIMDIANGVPASGYVDFFLPAALIDQTSKIVLGPSRIRGALDLNGEFAIDLPATDDPDLTPVGWQYRVKVRTNIWTTDVNATVPYTTSGTLEFTDML